MEPLEVGLIKSRLELRRKARITELFPRLRFAPSYEYCWNKCNERFLLDVSRQHNQHVLVLGSSGTGKSSLCKLLLNEIAATLSMPVIILDVHNEYVPYVKELNGRTISPKEVSLNIFELERESPLERAYDIAQLFRRILGLGDIQVYSLIKCIEQAYRLRGIYQEDPNSWGLRGPTIKEVFSVLELTLARTKGAGNSSLLTLNKRLYSLLASSTFGRKTAINFSELTKGITCLTLGDFASGEAQAIFVETFLRKLYGSMLAGGLTNKISIYILIDEAHKVVVSKGSELSLVAKIACEARKYGIGLIVSNQNARNLDREIIANCATSFIFYQKEPQEEEYVVSLLANGSGNSRRERLQEKLRSLRQFECLAVTSELRDPVQLEFRPVFISGTCLAADRKEAKVDTETVNEEAVLGKLEARPYKLNDLLGTFENRETAIELVNKLAGNSLVELQELNNLEGMKEVWVGKKRVEESLGHSAYVQMISDFLASKHIPRVILNRSNEPDMIMEINGCRIAVEIETGRKHDNGKILGMLERRAREFEKVLVVLTDKKQAGRYGEIVRRTSNGKVEVLEVFGFKEYLE